MKLLLVILLFICLGLQVLLWRVESDPLQYLWAKMALSLAAALILIIGAVFQVVPPVLAAFIVILAVFAAVRDYRNAHAVE